MTSEDFDTWLVVYSQFVGADSKSGISFALNNVSEAQDSSKVRKYNGRNGQRKRPMAVVTLRDLDPGATVYGFSISLNTINPRPAGVFSRTRPAGVGGRFCPPPLSNYRTECRRDTGKAANERSQRGRS